MAFALDALRGISDANPALSDPAGLKNNPQATWDLANLYVQQPQALPAVFDTLTGEVNADAADGSFQISRQFLSLMLDPSVNGRSGSIGTATTSFAAEDEAGMPLEIAAAYDAVLPRSTPKSFDQRWSAWGSGFGGVSDVTGDAAAAGTHNVSAGIYGFAGGLDFHWAPNNVVGFALAGGGGNWAVSQNLGSGRSDDFQAGFYAKGNLGAIYLAGALSIANQWMTTNRLAFGGDQLQAKFVGQSYGGRLEGGYRMALWGAGVTPYVAAQALAVHTPSYGETDLTDGGFGLNYAAATDIDYSAELGVRADGVLAALGAPLVWHLRAAYDHDWVSNPALTATFQAALLPGALPGAAASFVVNGAALPQNLALGSAGADFHVTRWMTIGAKLDAALAEHYQTYSGVGTVRMTW